MTADQLSKAKDQDIPASLIAMRRAAQAARELAMQTNTAIIVAQNGKLVRITADELRRVRKQ